MSEEYVDILDKNGKPTGEIKLKSEAHSKGLFHATVHVWFFTSNGYLLFQQRSLSKQTFPGLWDVSVAGHISAGEKVSNAALREIKEEIGLNIPENNLKKIGIHKYIRKHNNKLIDCEFHHIFISELKTPIKSLSLQESEVNDVKLLSIKDFEHILKHKHLSKNYVILDNQYYDVLLNGVKKEFN